MGMSYRKAVDAMCRGCIYDEANGGNWREQVEACTVWDCPLWGLRPVFMGRRGSVSSFPEKFDVEHMRGQLEVRRESAGSGKLLDVPRVENAVD